MNLFFAILSLVFGLGSIIVYHRRKIHFNGEIETAPQKVIRMEFISFMLAVIALVIFAILLNNLTPPFKN